MAKRSRAGTMPSKRTMNLYYKPDRTTGPATAALYILFALTVLLAAAKIGIYDKLYELRQAWEQLSRVQAEERQYAGRLSDYNEVLHRYHLYAATEDERATTDRLEILDLLDDHIRTVAEVNYVSIAGDSVSVRLSGVTLAETAEILRSLRDEPIVSDATVSTASTNGGGQADDPSMPVTANITITLAKEGE